MQKGKVAIRYLKITFKVIEFTFNFLCGCHPASYTNIVVGNDVNKM